MTYNSFSLSGSIVDVINQRIFPGTIHIENGRIKSVVEESVSETQCILPGLIDAHIHIESSMLVPTEFARAAVIHGTVATVSDPHEIANVLGIRGVEFMLENAGQTPFKFHFSAPSCVPATPFETAGAELSAPEIETLLQRDDIVSLSEMMNVPGVLNDAEDVKAKLKLAQAAGKVVDGHAPGLRGEAVKKYVEAGITTDHECFSLEEALEKLSLGMRVQIREGSAARNLDDLMPLLNEHFKECMLCSDDKHPDDLAEGHINLMVKRALATGVDPLKVLWSASVTPIKTYGLDVGLLQTNDPADLMIVDNLTDFNVLKTYIGANLVAEQGATKLVSPPVLAVNRFEAELQSAEAFKIKTSLPEVPVIDVIDGQLVTKKYLWSPDLDSDGFIKTNMDQDILKIAVLNRYALSKPAVALIRNFGLKEGAIASSVAHDSHNLVAVGTSDENLARAINLIIENKGGISAVTSRGDHVLPLPVAGIMSNDDAFKVGKRYGEMDDLAKEIGSQLSAPYMTLSFMALLVIPDIKLSDKGLFDGKSFEFMDAFE
ncbi:MAG: adenine deaminase [Candidatus Marinimicrobia bacterium]|jgi:adenine deaminase|nr:adenine deaminase [Candidatus Neomarinimicrobiota bacterium]MBT4361831.1 adenine deaminase [Candidatus Neomarinimicrobiota bacterium]MBT4714413.1 adenine deaminase [Candidatus Neomarinimicrobiota bacterium]MBT4946114.1 adenine deaminase [Candidatus Neomarinimicrobiota bacterium]MBT5268913.1 adenine deaminase [Candidatus Neomarinimicrobiota bacterium]